MGLNAIVGFLFILVSGNSVAAEPGQIILREHFSGKIFYEPIAFAEFHPTTIGGTLVVRAESGFVLKDTSYWNKESGYKALNLINLGGSIDISECGYPDDVQTEYLLNLVSYGKLKPIPGGQKYQVLKLCADCGLGVLRGSLSQVELKSAILRPFSGQNMIDLPIQFFRVVPRRVLSGVSKSWDEEQYPSN